MSAATAAKEDPRLATTKPPRECATCTFWDNSISDDRLQSGLCRKNAPEPTAIFNTVKIHQRSGIHFAPALWPVTLAGENCGEHRFAKLTSTPGGES